MNGYIFYRRTAISRVVDGHIGNSGNLRRNNIGRIQQSSKTDFDNRILNLLPAKI